MSVQALLLVQMGSNRRLWSARWDLRLDANWESDLLGSTTHLWPEQWKPGEYFAAGKSGGFAVYTSMEDVVLYAVGDDELGELGLQQYLHQLTLVLAARKKKETRLSRALLEDYPDFSSLLFATVSPGGQIAYTSVSDE